MPRQHEEIARDNRRREARDEIDMSQGHEKQFNVIITTRAVVVAEDIYGAKQMASACIANAPGAMVVDSTMNIKEARPKKKK